jgi:hypothetical protein
MSIELSRPKQGMASVIELLSGIVRFFPNTMIATLFVVGVAIGRISWVLVALGGILTAGIVISIQYIFTKGFHLGEVRDADIIAACSLLPSTKNEVFSQMPSLWMALTAFFATYIFMNARSVYSTPAQTPPGSTVNMNDVITVQQRKGVGLISMLAISTLALFLIIPQIRSACESTFGAVLGLALGIAMGSGWWHALAANGPNVYPDIHGVMIGLQPGPLRTSAAALACTPATS